MFTPPPNNCSLCPRLVTFRTANATAYPQYFNGAVPPFGALSAAMLVVGLAPGLKGANATGRPFTGDYAGIILYEALLNAGLAEGAYGARIDDGLLLKNVRISNAVRCVPPENKPTPQEVTTCRKFLTDEISAMPNLRVILSLGTISHQSVVRALGLKQPAYPFAHGAVHHVGQRRILLNSYHTSRYNISTKRLTRDMFDAIIAQAHHTINS